MSRRLALITGASSGIGLALAREYAANGWDLALVARREDRLRAQADQLQDQYGIDALVIPADLNDANAPQAILKAIEADDRQVDALINNAGFGLPGTYAQTQWQEQADFLQLMLTSYCELAHRVLPDMQARGFGRIINVASVAGLVPGTYGHTLYSAVKSALIKFSESLHLENKSTGVHVTAVCPGLTYSEFHDVNGTRDKVSQLPKYWWLSAEQVAEESYTASQANKAVIVPGLWWKFLTGLYKILPHGLALAITARQSAKLRNTETPASTDPR
ncbi:MAG: SDR family oxidoreductase [Alphaproteobacteria bacterium]|nr:SDR family oxidoreductase [Alphaproteobacteria bacterium]